MEQLLPVLFILAAGLIDLIQRWQRRAKRPPLEQEEESFASRRAPAPPPARKPPPAPPRARRPTPAAPAPEGPRGPRPAPPMVVRTPHPVLAALRRPADLRQGIIVSTILGRCPGME